MRNESVSWIIYLLCFDLHCGIGLRSDMMGSSFIVVALPGCTLLPPGRLSRLPWAPPFHRSINYVYDLGSFLCDSAVCGRDDKASLSHCGVLWINSYMALWGSCQITCVLAVLLLFGRPGNVHLWVWLCPCFSVWRSGQWKHAESKVLHVFTWASVA